MRLVKFDDVYGKEVYVNADQVTFLKAQANDTTEIYVTGDTERAAARVALPPDRVASIFGWARADH